MKEILIDLRKYDLADILKLDLISVDALLNRLEDALDEIEILKEKIHDMNNQEDEIDYYDTWKDGQLTENDRE